MRNDRVTRPTAHPEHETAGRLAAILEAAVDGIITIDEAGTIETVNPATLKIFGYEAHELIGRNVRVLMPEPYRSEHDAYLANYLRTGERRIIGIGRKVQGRRKDGSTFPLELAVSEIRLGARRFFTGIVRDVTERERAEAALRESEALSRRRLAELRAIYATAPVGLCFTDSEHRYVSVNERMAALNGLPVERHLGRTVREVLPAPLVDAAEAIRRRVVETGEPALDIELAGATAADAGAERRWLASYYPVRGADGAVLGVNAVVQDITERKRAEAALRESEERFRDFAAAASDWFWETDAEHRFTWFSPNVEALVGVPREWHYGKKRLELMAPGTDPAVVEAHRRVLDAHRPFRDFEYLRRGPRGDTWLSVSGVPVFDAEGRFRGYRGASRDITARKRAEAQRELLLAELSHRVKNSLAVVQALAGQTGARAATVPAFLDAFRGRLRALAAAHTLLTENDWRGARLRGLAEAALAAYLGHGGRVLLEEVADVALKPAAAQTFALVFHELATNAGKYGALSTPGGRVTLSARVVRGAGGDGGAELRIVWREAGGPPARPPERTGFGLTVIAQMVAYQHGGRVGLEWPAEGLLCRLVLPLGEATGVAG